jgi:hypothetical protein
MAMRIAAAMTAKISSVRRMVYCLVMASIGCLRRSRILGRQIKRRRRVASDSCLWLPSMGSECLVSAAVERLAPVPIE